MLAYSVLLVVVALVWIRTKPETTESAIARAISFAIPLIARAIFWFSVGNYAPRVGFAFAVTVLVESVDLLIKRHVPPPVNRWISNAGHNLDGRMRRDGEFCSDSYHPLTLGFVEPFGACDPLDAEIGPASLESPVTRAYVDVLAWDGELSHQCL